MYSPCSHVSCCCIVLYAPSTLHMSYKTQHWCKNTGQCVIHGSPATPSSFLYMISSGSGSSKQGESSYSDLDTGHPLLTKTNLWWSFADFQYLPFIFFHLGQNLSFSRQILFVKIMQGKKEVHFSSNSSISPSYICKISNFLPMYIYCDREIFLYTDCAMYTVYTARYGYH